MHFVLNEMGDGYPFDLMLIIVMSVCLEGEKGETAVLYSEPKDLKLEIEPCYIPMSEMNFWGKKRD